MDCRRWSVPCRDMADNATPAPHLRLRRAGRARPRGGQDSSTPMPSAGASPTTARTTPASTDPAVRARWAASTPRGPPAPGCPLVILYSDDLDATYAAVQAAGGAIDEEPFEFPGGRRFHFSRPGRQRARRCGSRPERLGAGVGSTREQARFAARCGRSAPASRGRTSSLGPDLRGAGGDESAARGSAERLERRRRPPTSAALRAPPSSSSARSTIAGACSARAARSTQRAGVPGGGLDGGRVVQVHQHVGHLGAPARHVEVGQRRRGVPEGPRGVRGRPRRRRCSWRGAAG